MSGGRSKWFLAGAWHPALIVKPADWVWFSTKRFEGL